MTEPDRPFRTPADPPKPRPWGPASYWRSGLVLLALVVAVLAGMRLFAGG
ncbi:hypothetical protein [Pararhizobium haloflavum]|nr:hypothetical protein [Pararhizobium haloflavum]